MNRPLFDTAATADTDGAESLSAIGQPMLKRSLHLTSLSLIVVLIIFRLLVAVLDSAEIVNDTANMILLLAGVMAQICLRLNLVRAATYVLLAGGTLGMFYMTIFGGFGGEYTLGGYMIVMFLTIVLLPGRSWLVVLFSTIFVIIASQVASHHLAGPDHPISIHIVDSALQIAYLIMGAATVGMLYQRIAKILGTVQQANAALRKSYNHSQILMETSLNPFFLVTAEQRIVDVNERACELFGYSREQFLQMNISDVEPNITRYKVRAAFNKMMRVGQFSALHARPVKRDGSVFSAEIHGQRVEFEDGELYYIVVTDITERVARENQLQEQAERLQLINDNVPIKIALFDTELRVKYANAAVANTHNTQQPVGQTLQETVGPEYYERVRHHFEQALAGDAVQYEELTKELDKTMMVQLVPHVIDDEVIGVFATGIDITELRETQQTLQRSNDIFDHVLNNVPARITYLETDGTIIYINDRLEEHFGVTASQAMGAIYTHILPDEYVSRIRPYVRKALSTKKEVVFDLPLVIADGSTIIERSYYFPHVTDGKVDAIFTMHVDVTDVRNTEDSLAKAQKLESLGVLAGGIAHDFNNLLVAMLGQSSLALAKIEETHKARRHIVQSIAASKRAAALTQQMLAYSGRGSFVIGALNLNELVENNLNLFVVSIPKSVQLITNLQTDLPKIEADMAQMQQLIMNLIINAGQAIGSENGHITITTSVQNLTNEGGDFWKITGDPLIEGAYVSIEIQDDGKGMDDETIGRIFDPFYTTKESGTGLGLAAALGIIRGHNGGIRLDSEVGRGTVFHLLFPVLEESEQWQSKLTAVSAEIPPSRMPQLTAS